MNLMNDLAKEADYTNLTDYAIQRNELRQNIGSEMKFYISELKAIGMEVAQLLKHIDPGSEVHGLLQNYIREFSSQTCQVAVIGQMKAGKSSFINALIGRSNFLPSDVNPWTTVVTRLHFGISELAGETAEFSFFGEQDWQQLAENGGNLRELIERFLPGYESERLKYQLEQMKSQALKRHGDVFYSLLGNAHSYEKISPEIIRQYVCVGEPWNTSSEAMGIGRYSDITQSADIYLESSNFSYPSTIIDTPGTNDPFFVRDEITCQNLDSADIFVVVLHAQQALTLTDLGLLRILQGLHKDRVVIFINRIDQLNNWQEDISHIEQHVRYILKKEFPSINFPIICGSANWGEQGRHYNDPDLFHLSGLPKTADIISRLMLRGRGRYSISSIISNLNLVLDSANAIIVNQKKKDLSKVDLPDTKSHTQTEEIEKLNDWISFLRESSTKASYFSVVYEQQLEELKYKILNKFRDDLSKIILTFAAEESNKFLRSLEHNPSSKLWKCDTTPARARLEIEFAEICKLAINRINAAQQVIANALKQLLGEAVPNADTSFIDFYDIMDSQPYLSNLALSHTLALELDGEWWKTWWSKKRQNSEWGTALTNLIKADFFPMAERLVESAKFELSESIRDSVNNFTAINTATVNIIEQDIELYSNYLSSVLNNYVQSDEETGIGGVVEEYIAKAESISTKLKKMQEEVSHQLG